MQFKKFMEELKGKQHKLDKNKNGKLDAHDFKLLRKEEQELVSEGAYEKAEENKRSADAAKKQGDMFAHHLHMADHHDNMAEWHDSKGRHSVADSHMKKSEQHHEMAMQHKDKVKKEEVDLEEGLQQKLRKYVPGYAKRQIDKKMDDQKFGRTDVDKDANYWRYKKVQDKLKKEEVQIDEVSDATKANYIKAARKSVQALDKSGKEEKRDQRSITANRVYSGMSDKAKKMANEEVELDEAKSPQQKADFDRMMAGAMSRAAYNAKWKKPLKSDAKVIYGKNVKEETELDEADVQARADYKLDKAGRKYHKQIAFKDGSNDEANEKNEVREATQFGLPAHSKSHVEKKIKAGDWEATHDIKTGRHLEIIDHSKGGKRKTIHVKEELDMNEEMTDAQKAERERLVKGMKKNIAGFKAKYGERAKEVMYATATKQAMKEETLEEGADQHKVMVTVSDPNHPAVSQRKEQIMKRVIVKADNKDHAVTKAKEFYKKKGYKVHDAEYHSTQPKSTLKTEEAQLEEAKMSDTDKKAAFTVHHALKSGEQVSQGYGMAIKSTHNELKRKYGSDWRKKAGIKEEVELEEAFINGREYASQGVMHPDHAKFHKTGNSMDFYAHGTGDKISGKVTKNDGKEVHIQADKSSGGKVHKFKVTPHLPKPVNEEVLDEAVESGNKGYGYHGQHDSEVADKKYSAAHATVKKVAGEAGHLKDAKKPNVMVKHYLDSRHGRHLAGLEHDHEYIKKDFGKFKKSYKESDFAKEGLDFDEEGTLMSEKKTYAQFMEQLLEYTPGPGGVTRHVGTYGTAKGAKYGNTNYDDEHMDKNDDDKKEQPAVKRGRGRPAGSKSGANQKVTSGKSYGGIATHSLHLPSSNR